LKVSWSAASALIIDCDQIFASTRGHPISKSSTAGTTEEIVTTGTSFQAFEFRILLAVQKTSPWSRYGGGARCVIRGKPAAVPAKNQKSVCRLTVFAQVTSTGRAAGANSGR
jgi:hypothetical protein